MHDHGELDSLTGLLNMRGFVERLPREMARSRQYGKPLTLALCDIDKFKPVNDEYGHHAGDEILKDIAARMQTVAHPDAIMGRLGGDEFRSPLAGLDAREREGVRCTLPRDDRHQTENGT